MDKLLRELLLFAKTQVGFILFVTQYSVLLCGYSFIELQTRNSTKAVSSTFYYQLPPT